MFIFFVTQHALTDKHTTKKIVWCFVAIHSKFMKLPVWTDQYSRGHIQQEGQSNYGITDVPVFH